MKQFIGMLFLLFSLSAAAGQAETWLQRVPESAGTWNTWTPIPNDSFFEVPASKLPTAESWLSEAPYSVQEQSGVSYFGRPDFVCTLPAKTYLIRAAYINGGTGEFGLYWAGSALVVSHGALGPSRPPSKTALIVCLSKAPTAIFSSLSTAL